MLISPLRGGLAVWALLVLASGGIAAQGRIPVCQRAVFEGEAAFGQGFERPIGGGLRWMLEPLASGWIIRVLPATGPRGRHDYAELATPPYQSVTPLLISTDYSFRAQDVVGWNPRHFHFAVNAQQFRDLSAAYEAYMSSPGPATEAKLGELAARTQEGELEILDAYLIPGQADQAAMASAVASHFSTTAHTVQQPDGKETAELGRVTWLRFRVRLDLPAGWLPPQGLKTEQYVCPSPGKPTSPLARASHP